MFIKWSSELKKCGWGDYYRLRLKVVLDLEICGAECEVSLYALKSGNADVRRTKHEMMYELARLINEKYEEQERKYYEGRNQ